MFKFLTIVFVLIASCELVLPAYAAGGDRGDVGYWLARYDEVRSGDLYDRAFEVFRRVLLAADRRAGVEPRLYVIDYDGLPWAQSLEDGSVVLTARAVEFCLKGQDRDAGDARLAFVIGHELSHQFNGDFWPFRFLESAGDNPELSDLRRFAVSTENVKAMELQADQYGIIYSSIAGYRTDVITAGDTGFFSSWASTTDPRLVGLSSTHPSVKQRVFSVVSRLREVTDRLEFFHAGVLAYELGWYPESIALLGEFMRYYPSREVYHNIGLAYLGLAIEDYREAYRTDGIPFRLSVEIDQETRGEAIDVGRDDNTPEGRYRLYTERALGYLKKAVESDPYYARGRNSLGAAYIVEGSYYNALSELDEAARLSPESDLIINNRAVAYFLLGDRLGNDSFMEIAAADFEKIAGRSRCDRYAYNLSVAARLMGRSPAELSMAVEFEGDAWPVGHSIPELPAPGSEFDGEGFVRSGEVSAGGHDLLALFRSADGRVTVLVKDGRVMLVARSSNADELKSVSENRRSCYEDNGFRRVGSGRGIIQGREVYYGAGG